MEEQDNGQITPEVVETTEAAQSQAAPQVEGTEPETGDKPPVEKTFTQAELDAILEKKTAKLIRQREQERGKREAYEQQMARFQPPVQANSKPSISQFNGDAEAYADAVADWKIDQAQQQQRAQESQKSQSKFQTKRDEFIADLEETDGFDMKAFNRLPISPVVAEAILDSDIGTKLAIHLTTNPDDASRIANLSPARQAAEIGKLEAKLSTAASKRPSNAPSPISPVGGKGSSVTSDIYDARLASDTRAFS